MQSLRRMVVLLATSGLTLGSAGCALFSPPLEVVEQVDLARYAGRWYEIARYPVFFEQGCVGVTADYTLLENGTVRVVNTCFEESLDGEVRTIEGTARITDPETNARLAVSFFGPFEGPYWIIDLDADYRWAVVGSPDRGTLWVLSRTPQLDAAVYDDILSRLPDLGFDPERLEPTPQPEGA